MKERKADECASVPAIPADTRLGSPVTRRGLLKGVGAVTAAGLSPVLAGCSSDDDDDNQKPPITGPETLFQHGVASGDPLPDAVILWTRVSPDGDAPVEVKWELAAEPDFAATLKSGTFTTDSSRDFTVKVDATGLEAGTTYYYRFKAQQRVSPIGRTRTAPAGSVDRLRFGLVSCASYAHGYFHVYRALAARPDLDAVLHLGDYIYEYGSGEYGEVRPYEPAHEIVKLEDYRTRHAYYKLEENLQELHRQHVFITIWDDHETANDSWKDGAENHQPDTEGSFADRKAAAEQAYFEWMPIRDTSDHHIFRKIPFGDLADLILLDTRLWGRTLQMGLVGPPPTPDPTRTLLGDDQAAWLEGELSASTATWRLIGQQVMIGNLILSVDPPTIVNLDQWHGYPESRKRFIDFLRSTNAKDVVVLTGDIHSSWAHEIVNNPNDPAEYDPTTDRGAVAVEFVTPAVTSPGIPEGFLPAIETSRPFNPQLRYVEPSLRGYIILDVTPERTQAAWFHFADITAPTPGAESFAEAWAVAAGSNRLVKDAQYAPDRQDAPDPAP